MFRWFDERLGLAGFARNSLRKVFPDHPAFLLGEVALFCLVVLVATGVYLTLFYVPDATPVTYQGSYVPLQGQTVSRAYASTLELSFDVVAGLVMRQVHHWAALVFVAAIVVHQLRVFFTGAYRKPREINWLIGIGLLVFALAMGITGYSLPDDLLSGTGLRIIYSAVISIPFIGPWAAFLLFGGEFPTETIISRLFVFHIMLLPALLLGMVAVHLGVLWRQKHTQFPGPLATEHNVVGKSFWPTQVFKSSGLLLLTAAVLGLMGGLIQINPVWSYGPFDATRVSAPSQPDWYVGWLDGSLRLFPPIEFTLLGVTIPSPFIPGILLPGIAFGIMTLWPFIESWVTGDHREHHLLDRPRDAPLRTAIGAAALTVFIVLTLSAGNDVAAIILHVPVEATTNLLRIGVLVLPIVVGFVTFRICRELQRRERRDRAGAGPAPRAVRLVRTEDGGFEESEV
ncbi:MAG TPA: cytochrome bc complex cytochrome b subunit [Candidatus Limnocylindria bacterium]|jgi:ubiquinol-cytochrome c reductase cytochrome b subunit|nr:cytochrome bc complex cytochrome b subunit [Candidatus Limnocylindria bacterium]